ncbi:MAG: GH92 family glycosyl hydrolase [Bacteroidales bacterium]
MKKTLFRIGFLQGFFLLLLSACNSTEKDYAAYVNPLIGTGGHGHTYPGATVPNGMIQPSPDTRIYEWDACSGYYYADSSINGFSHTHLSGTGCGDYGDILLMPTVGKQEIQPLGKKSQQMAYASSFSHDSEIAEPGYYSVFLNRYNVRAELSATERAAIHRYTFPKSNASGFIVDLDYSLQWQTNDEMELEVISNTEIRGRKKTMYWAFDQYINFYMKFSKPFTYTMVNDTLSKNSENKEYARSKVMLQFETQEQEQILVKVGISAVDMDGAKKNVEADLPNWDFDKVKISARSKWNKFLASIDIETLNEEQRIMFYTALYHTGTQPNLFADVDGRYLGMDLKIHQGTVKDPIYTIFSLWDTFRGYHPLMTIINPKLNEAFIRSLIQKHKEGGVLPMWELAGNYTGTMIGYHAVSVIVDAYIKGDRNFDIEEAYRACLRVADYDTAGIKCPALVLPHLMPQAKYWKNKIGYVPCDKDNEAVAKGLEYAYNDWCISIFAEAMGDKQNQDKYATFANAYKKYFDPSTRFMRGLDSKGKWRTPFSPRSSTHRSDDYCEGTAWQWTWFVPHDIDGLVSLMGGRESFIQKLDSLFTAESSLEGDAVSVDISGLIGQYAHGNEPSHHIAHLYNYVGKPYKTQEIIDSVLHSLYFNDPNGLSGNEDCGQMSAWYILNAMGFYQVCPGKPVYSIGRPLFDKATINLKNGKKFTIIAKNNSRQNKYIQSMLLNNQTLKQPFITHNDIMHGGVLEFVMGNTPVK